MTAETKEAAQLLHDLVACFTSKPRECRIIVHEREEGGADFELDPDAADMRKLIGRSGAHRRALGKIVSSWHPAGSYQLMRLREPTRGQPEPFMRERDPVRNYDAQPAAQLLDRLITASNPCGAEVIPEQTATKPTCCITLIINLRSRLAFDLLTAIDRDGISVIGALQTIFLAYGCKEGVIFRIEIE
jgi:predicted RNA-binding protein YlqC (UPF0109 family)